MTELRQHNIIWSSLTPYTSPVTDWYLIDVTTLLKIHSPPTICCYICVRIQSIWLIQCCTWSWRWHTIYSYSSWSRSCYSWYTTRSTVGPGLSGWFTNSYIHSSFCTSYSKRQHRLTICRISHFYSKYELWMYSTVNCNLTCHKSIRYKEKAMTKWKRSIIVSQKIFSIDLIYICQPEFNMMTTACLSSNPRSIALLSIPRALQLSIYNQIVVFGT